MPAFTFVRGEWLDGGGWKNSSLTLKDGEREREREKKKKMRWV